MLWHTIAALGKFCPLLLSTASLICLAIVFAGCTSSSSPSGLYFIKVSYAAAFLTADLFREPGELDRFSGDQ